MLSMISTNRDVRRIPRYLRLRPIVGESGKSEHCGWTVYRHCYIWLQHYRHSLAKRSALGNLPSCKPHTRWVFATRNKPIQGYDLAWCVTCSSMWTYIALLLCTSSAYFSVSYIKTSLLIRTWATHPSIRIPYARALAVGEHPSVRPFVLP
ncbi:hypothetical protein BDV23DRAFT_98953 [Aspergillus alliaceus]|uniref:Uncharacterized protein n=1 Tax=Petromyces alliaceus TaxID=209559 RepID=A0A5N7C5F1_PETAA|nr:hypothetical protein BDV23DRAFT_98953 [Aspergillus alliaceus]